MTRDEVYAAWAPAASAWSDWAKPVLFAQMPAAWENESARPLVLPPPLPFDIGSASRTAIVADLPSDFSALLALALAPQGFQPVPLYNGAAHGSYAPLVPPDSMEVSAAIDAWRIMRVLWTGAERLQHLALPDGAPPLFLLDSDRRAGQRAAIPGIFDNRWLSFPTDFPSAAFLRARDVTSALLVTREPDVPTDLSHTLLRWQQAGIAISCFQMESDSAARPIIIRRPHFFHAAWYHFTATLGLRPRLLGGFGGIVPHPSSG